MTEREALATATQNVIAQAMERAFEVAALQAEKWKQPSYLKLHAGEMTAQEMRTALAVAGGIAAQLRALAKA